MYSCNLDVFKFRAGREYLLESECITKLILTLEPFFKMNTVTGNYWLNQHCWKLVLSPLEMGQNVQAISAKYE